MPELTGDWSEQAKQLETMGRTRDAGRLHERNNSFAEAIRLFEAGGDVKSALRAAVAGKDMDAARRLVSGLPADQVVPTLEKAGAYELLMEQYVAKADFENVARLYERARQYDQAALAYERANKLTQARKSYERARDMASANRVRGLEVKSLVERGDRLGAATLLAAAGQRREAVEVLSPLPPPKAFHFMQRLKLDEEAKALAQRELARADEEKKPAGRARWLELLGETAAAAEAWEQAGRKEKALPLHEQLGNLARAAQLAEELQHRVKAIELYTRLNDAAGLERANALPETPPAPPPSASKESEADAESPPPASSPEGQESQ
jgi:tetratricopeptide (TPR) repeat protein